MFAGHPLTTVLLALAPAIFAWWNNRRLFGKGDDPALPELLAGYRRANARAIGIAAVLMIVLGGVDAAWGFPLMIALLIAVDHPLRVRLLGETWGFGRYLWYTALSIVGGFGFWIALGFTPTIVQATVRAVGNERWWIALALIPVLFAWEEWYPLIWLRTHAAEPLTRADLVPRFEAISHLAGTARPRVYRVGAQGSRFVNAVALPSVRRPAVAMGNALLDLLDADEIAAIYAHEIAHFDHYTPRHVRRAQLVNRALIVAGVVLPLVGILARPDLARWFGWVWPVAVLVALARRASKSQQHETESDLRAAALCGDPEALVRGLVKLHLHARVPRRWAVDVERAATHPSLVRRIQAIRGGAAAAAEQLGAATVVRSTREGSWLVFDDARAYWLDGVTPNTAPELPALRDAATSYRAVNYQDLAELRVGATGQTRALHARARTGDAWSVPIASDDVARVQRTLDVVDLKLGRAGPPPARGMSQLLALIALSVAIVAGQTGVVLVPIALALWRPAPASLAALGAMSIARAAFGALEGSYWLSEEIVGLALVALAGLGVAALYMAARQARSGEAGAHFGLTMAVLAVVAGFVAAPVLWEAVGVPNARVIGTPLLATLGTTMFGMAAALFTVRKPAMRRLGYAGLVAAACVAVLGADRAAFSVRGALSETTAQATLVSEMDLGAAAQGLKVSPDGMSFLVTRLLTGRRPSASAGLALLAGRLGGPVREIAALEGDFVDDERILVLDVLDLGIELRLERADRTAPPLWADTLTDIDLHEPRLLVDRDAGSWTILGSGVDTDGTGLIAGRIGEKGTMRRVVIPDTLAMMGDPIVFGPASSVIVPTFPSAAGRPPTSPWMISLFFGMTMMRTELWRVSGDSARPVATLRGPPQCGTPAGGAAACVTRGGSSTWVYSVNAAGETTEIAQLPARDLGVVAVGPGLHAASMTFERAILVLDLAARRLTRIPMPPKSDYASEVRAGPGYVVTLSYAENRRSKVRFYRLAGGG